MTREALIAALERLEFTADYYDIEIADAKRVYKPHRIPHWEAERAKHEAVVAQVKAALAAPAPEPDDCVCYRTSMSNCPVHGAPEPVEHTGCACRWDAKNTRTATCERHQGWLDVIADWSNRARAAEAETATFHARIANLEVALRKIASGEPWPVNIALDALEGL